MKKNKTAFIIPGYSESKANNPAYSKIAGYFKNNGIKGVVVDIDWKYRTMSEYVDQFQKTYFKNKKAAEVYFLGFSFGAMIAFISSAKLRPKAQILCSLSPYFREDFPRIREWWKRYIGKKRLADLHGISFNALSKKVYAKTIILAGDKEVKEVYHRAKDAERRIKNSRLTMIAGARHKINQREYLLAIKEEIYNL